MQVWFNTDNFVTRLIGPETAHIIDSYKNDAASYDALQRYAEAQARIIEAKNAFKEKMAAGKRAKREAPGRRNDFLSYIAKINRNLALSIFIKSIYYCPIDTGALRASARITEASGGFVIEYGNKTVDYATYVHEIPPEKAEHKFPTQNKFLETAAVEVMDEFRRTEADINALISKYKLEGIPKVTLPTIKISLKPLKLFIGYNDNLLRYSIRQLGASDKKIEAWSNLFNSSNELKEHDVIDDDWNSPMFGDFHSDEYIDYLLDNTQSREYFDLMYDSIMNQQYTGNKTTKEVTKAFVLKAFRKAKFMK